MGEYYAAPRKSGALYGQRHAFGDSYYSGVPYYGRSYNEYDSDYGYGYRKREPKELGPDIKKSIAALSEPSIGNPSGKKSYKKTSFIKKAGKVAMDCALDPYCRKGALAVGTHAVNAATSLGSYVSSYMDKKIVSDEKKQNEIKTSPPSKPAPYKYKAKVKPMLEKYGKPKGPRAPGKPAVPMEWRPTIPPKYTHPELTPAQEAEFVRRLKRL